MTNEEFYQYVQQAQLGDRQAMQQIIESFYPLIRKTARSLKPSLSKDYEQTVIEKIVRAVHHYDLNSIPGIVDFCKNFDLD